MITRTTAEKALYKHAGLFAANNAKYEVMLENQPLKNGKPFAPKANSLWSKVLIDYSPSVNAGFGNKPCIRDFGIVIIRCYAPKNSGTLAMSELTDLWISHFKNFAVPHLEVYRVNQAFTPRLPLNDEEEKLNNDFYVKVIYAEFRIN